MSTYLATGIVQEIVIDKRQIKYSDITVDKITKKLQNELNLDCYNYTEDSEGHYWKIKPKTLEENLVEFLSIQFQMYQNKTDSNMQEVIRQLGEAANGKEIIKLAEK